MEFSQTELQRYARHLILPAVGLDGQKRLGAAKVACVGAGGLGSPVLMYLAAAGVGHLGIIDGDQVDLSNLQRQIIHGTPDVGQPKTDSAARAIARLNPHVKTSLSSVRLSSQNALDILAAFDVVVDCTDNFPARYVINDACFFLQKPLVYGSIFQFEGQASVFAPSLGGPCYRCLFREPPPPGVAPSCEAAGVLGVLPGLVGCLQATEAIKLILGQGAPLLGRLLVVNALEMKFRELKLRRDPECPLCGENPSIKKLTDCQPVCNINMSPASPHPDEVTVQHLKQALDDPALNICVVDVREMDEIRIASLPGTQVIPMSCLAQKYSELNPEQTTYVLCKSGGRSLRAVHFLRSKGFNNTKSVKGGILAWAHEIDPTLPRY